MYTKLTKEDVFKLAKNQQLYAKNLIANHKLNTNLVENRTPIDNSIIGYITDSDKNDIDIAVKIARKSLESGNWSNLSPSKRKDILLKWAQLLQENMEELAALDCIDAGKPITECLNTDLPATIETIKWYAQAIDKIFDKIAPSGNDNLALIVKEPIGVVGIVLPWNFPAQMFAWKVAPALSMGNSVIVKPAELTSLSAYKMVQLAHIAGVPQEVLSLVCGTGEKAGYALGMHMDVDMISFTGSGEVGRLFLQYSSQSNLKEIVLECGGKSPQIVFNDADLDNCINDILNAAFWNMGENCSCGSRLLVHSSIKNDLLDKLKNALNSWKVGNPINEDVSIGPMVEQSHFNKVKYYLEKTLQQGGKIFTGGKIFYDLGSGWYIEPTIFDKITPDMDIFQEEVFGPLLAVTTFETIDEAVKLANNTTYGLAASFYTQNMKTAHIVSKSLKAGTISINGFSEGDITTPFGGFKQSGFGGRDKGLEALEQYVQTKTIWHKI